MSLNSRLLIGLACASTLVAARPARACGPNLPSALLQREHLDLCAAPHLRFESVLAAMTPATTLRASTISTADAEQADLRAALLDAKIDPDEIDARLAAVAEYREQLDAPARREEPPVSLPELPDEFRLYLLGARAWVDRDYALAERRFTELLELPPEQRRWRSTWAAYMLARLHSSIGSRCRQNDRAYARVRELVDAGFHDSLGLAAASYGQQGQCWYYADEPVRAIRLYLEQLATGDVTAKESIDFTIEARFIAAQDGDAELDELARDPDLRELVGVWLIADTHARPHWTQAWLEAIERGSLQRVVEAGPLAWGAYESGDMDAAARWARLGADDIDHGDLLARWVLAKLELREGDVEAAAAALERIDLELESDASYAGLRLGEWRYSGGDDRAAASTAAELGVVELHRDRFEAALEAFVRARAYLDAAYVAEQIMTLDELGEHFERSAARPDDAFDQRLRWLYARRLARVGQWRRALPYYPDRWRAEAEAEADDLDALDDPSLGNVERARLLWRVARRTRDYGMELRGTELDPDWTLHGGQFSQTTIWEIRGDDTGPTGPSELERARYYANRHGDDEPLRRFHYRWVAAEQAWEAAELLPDQHPATARVLCIAGTWIADRDPAGAERFYQALVRRNRAVDIAQWADRARWFPGPERCSLTGIDFAQPAVHVPTPPPSPERRIDPRALIGRAWPIAALFGLFAIVGLLLVPGRSKESSRPRAP